MTKRLLSDADEPSGRAAELIRLFHELGFSTTAEIITDDIFLRRRSKLDDQATDSFSQVGADESPNQDSPQAVEVKDDTAPPLEDLEIVEVIREAIEETIVAPLKMLNEVARIAQELAPASLRSDEIANHIPSIQLNDDADDLVWCTPASFKHAEEVEKLIPRIIAWLSEPLPQRD